jgi:hypothetical protein
MNGTITRPVKVEYKKRKSIRAFKIWDSQILNTAMVHAAEILEQLERDADIQQIDPMELAPTLIPTPVLYLLADSYLHSYKALLKESLLNTGNPTSNPNIH